MNTTKEQIDLLENERLFGNGIDLFKSYYATKFIYNILKTIGARDVHDNEWYQAVATYLSYTEIAEIYNTVLPTATREKIAEGNRRNCPPEMETDDTPAECLEYLGKNILYRKKMWKRLAEAYEKRLAEFKTELARNGRMESALELRCREIKKLFGLNNLEMEILLSIFFSATSYLQLGDFDLKNYRQTEKITVLSKAIGISDVEAAQLLDQDHNINKFGLIDEDCDLERTFLSYLSGISSKPLAERFWRKYTDDILPWEFHGKLAEKNGKNLQEMIRNKKPETGLSILLFGVAGSGKTSFAASLAKSLGKELYLIAQNDENSRHMSYSPAFRYAALAVAQKQLDPTTCILAVDECDKMVENRSLGGGLLSMLGVEPSGGRDGESKGQLNTVIDQNRHTVLWICNSKQDAIDPSSRRRFDYSIFFDELSGMTRRCIWQNALKSYHCEGKLSDVFMERISMRYKVNPGGIAVAVKNAAAICDGDPQKSLENEVLIFLKAHCTLLGIQESPEEMLEPARDYSLEGLNIHSGIKLPRLVEVCRKFLKTAENIDANRDQPRLNLLLFGVPGSGKTEFVKYLARALDKRLCIKNASDLLSCYLGGTEMRLAAAFAEAEANGEILFMDEGDSLLNSREKAAHIWEVSQVNTLLSEMERFRGIFIVGTNLVQRLDPAALRRFSFRMHFDYLDNRGKEIFYQTYFKPLGLPELSLDDKKILTGIDSLTPSDFRNVRQQFFYLSDSDLTNREVLEALSTEVQSKNSGSDYTSLGKIVSKMGF